MYLICFDALGIKNGYTGSYTRVDGTKITGPSLSNLVAASDASAGKALRAKLDATLAKMQVIVDTAETGEAYDQMIGEGNETGNQNVMDAINALTSQTRAIEKVVAA